VIMLVGLLGIVGYQYRRSGVLLTPGSAWLLTSIILPVYVAYPLAVSPESLLTIGQQYNATGMEISSDELLVIVSVAVICVILAYVLTPKVFRRITIGFASQKLKSNLTIDNLTAGACVSALSGIALVWIFFSLTGEIPLLNRSPVSMREEILANNPLRYIYTAGFTMANVGTIFLMAGLALRSIRNYKALAYGVTILVCVTNLLTASRGNFLEPFAVAAVIYFSVRSKQLTLARLPLLMAGALLAAAALQMLRRHGAYGWDDLVNEILHGNTLFANFRDTAWVLMNFERHRYPFMYGKTILAGFLGFVPRSVLPFREQYGWGFVSREVVHYTSPFHPGLAHVVFGDWYINFGYPGVVLEGLLFGFILRLLDCRLFHILRQGNQIPERLAYWTVFKLWFMVVVLGYIFSSALTVLLYPYLLGYFLILLVANATRTIFVRRRPADEFAIGAGWQSGQIASQRPGTGGRGDIARRV